MWIYEFLSALRIIFSWTSEISYLLLVEIPRFPLCSFVYPEFPLKHIQSICCDWHTWLRSIQPCFFIKQCFHLTNIFCLVVLCLFCFVYLLTFWLYGWEQCSIYRLVSVTWTERRLWTCISFKELKWLLSQKLTELFFFEGWIWFFLVYNWHKKRSFFALPIYNVK